MPNKNTFDIKPIRDFIHSNLVEMIDNKFWLTTKDAFNKENTYYYTK